jgi:hypothetical protein
MNLGNHSMRVRRAVAHRQTQEQSVQRRRVLSMSTQDASDARQTPEMRHEAAKTDLR